MMSPGEIEIGSSVTVYESKGVVSQAVRDGNGKIQGQEMTYPFHVFHGAPLLVKAKQLPYVVVEFGNAPFILDTRLVTFMEISQEYVEAIVPATPDSKKKLPDATEKAIDEMMQRLAERHKK